MSDKRIIETEAMFIKSTKPSLIIDEVDEITTIGVIYDGTEQGKDALVSASEFAKKFQMPLKIIAADDYLEPFKNLAITTNEKMNALQENAKSFASENGVAAEVDMIIGDRVKQILDVFEGPSNEEPKLSTKLTKFLEQNQFDILVTGAPLFRKEKEESYFGFYLTKLLSNSEIKANFLIVSDTREELSNTILSFVSVDQQPKSIVALTRRSLAIADEKNDIKLFGVVEDKIIETVARADLTDEQDDEDLDLIGVGERLKNKMEDTLSSIEISDKISYKSFSFEVSTGVMASTIKTTLENENPGLVLVRSVSRSAQYLDPVAEQITLTVLNAGYPVYLIWD